MYCSKIAVPYDAQKIRQKHFGGASHGFSKGCKEIDEEGWRCCGVGQARALLLFTYFEALVQVGRWGQGCWLARLRCGVQFALQGWDRGLRTFSWGWWSLLERRQVEVWRYILQVVSVVEDIYTEGKRDVLILAVAILVAVSLLQDRMYVSFCRVIILISFSSYIPAI